MTLILRKCYKNGYSSRDFFYGQTGERVVCPDWDPKPECGNGLHGLLNGNGNWELLEGTYWLVIDADDQIVTIDECKCKFNTGVVKFHGTTEELEKTNIVNEFMLDENSTINWGRSIGNHDLLINRFHNSTFAYRWAYYVGTKKNILKHRITTSDDAYDWASQFGDCDIMISKIDDSKNAYKWARDIGNENIMIDKITEPGHAILWALNIGNQNIMKQIVAKDSTWIPTWNYYFQNNKI